jgi:excisionase family DNA binding protein
MELERLLNNTEAAKLLNLSPFSLRGKVSRKEIPHIKVGRRTLFSPSDLQAWVEANKVQPRPTRERS